MKIVIDKDWCLRMAHIENGAEVGAGAVARDPEMPPGPCLECDGSGWLDDDRTEMCCECDGTGTEIVSD
jgi:hypothetical protein